MAIDGLNTTNTNSALNSAAASSATSSLTSGSTPTNPNAELTQEDFLALLLTELKYQDPNEPMDAQKMLEQTSMLSQLSMQMKTNEVMQSLASQMENAFSMTAMNALGSYAVIDNSVTKDAATSSLGIPVNFSEDITGANIEITDKSGNVVRNIDLGPMKAGASTINWDLLSNNKNTVDDGTYKYTVTYTNADGQQKQMAMNNFLVEGVRFKDGQAQFKIGDSYINADRISEFNAWAQQS